MEQSHAISFIGAGNLAWHLAPELENRGHKILEVKSKSLSNAEKLVQRLYRAEAKKDYDFSQSQANIFIIAVRDDAIEEVISELILPDQSMVIHTSGAQPLDKLKAVAAPEQGVLYFLQTFTKDKRVFFDDIPVLYEGNNLKSNQILQQLASSLSKKVIQVNSDQRKAIHVSAVFACNLTNHLFYLAQNILKKEHLPYELLEPLIRETIDKSLSLGPAKAQTGPAVRGDLETMDRHMHYLEFNARYAEIYRTISQDILDHYL
ncbi:MAG: Rossmann-like and DUF2520 domain-containing protein [Candidatus Cyclobacteriaceae bacterium M3_2C_046]